MWLIVVGIATAAMGLALMYSIWRGSGHERSIRKISSEVERLSSELSRVSGLSAPTRGPLKVVEEVSLTTPHLPIKEQAFVTQQELQSHLNDLLLRVKGLDIEIASINAKLSNSKQEMSSTKEEIQTSKNFEDLAADIGSLSRNKSKQESHHRLPEIVDTMEKRHASGAVIPKPVDAYIVMHQPDSRGFAEVASLSLCGQFEPRRMIIQIDVNGDFRMRVEHQQSSTDFQSYLLRDFVSLFVTLDELPQQHVQCAVFTFTWARRDARQNLMFCVPTSSAVVDDFIHFLDKTFETTVIKFPRAKSLL